MFYYLFFIFVSVYGWKIFSRIYDKWETPSTYEEPDI